MQTMQKKLVFLGTGGTIAGCSNDASDNTGYRAGQFDIASLLATIPQLQRTLAGCHAEWEQVVQCDSKDMSFAIWQALAQRVLTYLNAPDVAALIITHGTDTLEETAFFLSQIVPFELVKNKPIVLTCAMRPASSYAPDGPQNIADAVTVAQDVSAQGVLVVCAGSIHCGQNVQKIHPYRLNAFDSGDAGPLGFVEEGAVRWVHPYPIPPIHLDAIQLLPAKWPQVEIVMSYAGVSGAVVDALCTDTALAGIVVAATGNGTVHENLERALHRAESRGIRVVRTSRCPYGAIVGTEGLSPVKARIALILTLMNARNTALPPESTQSAVDGN